MARKAGLIVIFYKQRGCRTTGTVVGTIADYLTTALGWRRGGSAFFTSPTRPRKIIGSYQEHTNKPRDIFFAAVDYGINALALIELNSFLDLWHW